MQCINKIKAGWDSAGKLTFSKKRASREIEGFELECRKCLPCRLNNAREKAIRAYHESRMHKESIFLTLTYADEHLKSPWLQYHDFQQFMKDLLKERRKNITDPDVSKSLAIPLMVTGEYGDKNKRPHWHALLFNYFPADAKKIRTTNLGHTVYGSDLLSRLWGKGLIEFGQITLDSANYTARYAAKKLTHGNDDEHDYHPIHRTSSKHAIGKKWIEKYWKQTFDLGFVYLPNGQKTKIPRYYVDWLKKNKPDEWRTYVTTLRLDLQKTASEKSKQEEIQYLIDLANLPWGYPRPLDRKKVKLIILKQKFKTLQEKLSL